MVGWQVVRVGGASVLLLSVVCCTIVCPAAASKGAAATLLDFGYYWSRSPNDGHFGPGVW
eukprot:SAG31_NODE_21080_length_553_cov_1.002179_1_plen_59_part_10